MQYLCRYSLLEHQQKSFLEDSKSSSDDDGDVLQRMDIVRKMERPKKKASEKMLLN